MKTFHRRAIVAALLAATFASGAAEAQTKFYARRTLPQASASAAAPKVYTGTWYGNGVATESACNASTGKKTVTYQPQCGTGSDGEGGYSEIVADSECDPDKKPSANQQVLDCISCSGSLAGPKTTGYGPASGSRSSSGGFRVQKSDFSASSVRAACEGSGSSFGAYSTRGCNVVDRGTYYEISMFANNGALGTNSMTSGSYTMDCSR